MSVEVSPEKESTPKKSKLTIHLDTPICAANTSPSAQERSTKKVFNVPEKYKNILEGKTDSPSPGKPALSGLTVKPSAQEIRNSVQKSPAKGVSSPPVSDAPKPTKFVPRFIPGAARPAPPMKGQKEIPGGLPNCLAGMVFLTTGVLDSLEREDAQALIEKYGGKVAKSVTKALTHAIIGTEPGSKKMEELNERPEIVKLNEDQFFELIRSSSPNEKAAKEAEKLKQKKDAEKAKEIEKITASIMEKAVSPPKSSAPSSFSSSSQSAVPARVVVENGNPLWTDKHKPTKSAELIGNPSVVDKVRQFLNAWKTGGKKEFNAVLLSGSPGIGKTTLAHILAKEAGYEAVEFNASDTRNKNAVEKSLMDMVENRSVGEFFKSASTAPTNVLKKVCVIMDEVDGMSSGDRGGMQALIQLVKRTKVPVICCCNDRQDPKVRSLRNYCIDLPLRRPTADQALPRLLAISRAEGMKIEEQSMRAMLESCHGDMRQVLNLMQMLAVTQKEFKSTTAAQTQKLLDSAVKNIDLGPFDVCPKIFSPPSSPPPGQTIQDVIRGIIDEKMNLYYMDKDLIPLMIQENYPMYTPLLKNAPNGGPNGILNHLKCLSSTADSIAFSDVIDTQIRQNQLWELSPVHALFSTVVPGYYMRSSTSARINFPDWLGKNSKARKYQRIVRELHTRMQMAASANRDEILLNYLPSFRYPLSLPLVQKGVDAVDCVVELMDAYYLAREDWDSIDELTSYPGFKDPFADVESKVKAALTREYTKNSKHFIPVSKAASSFTTAADITAEDDDNPAASTAATEEENADAGEDEDPGKDKLIKQKAVKKAGKDSEESGTAKKKKAK